MPFIKLPFYLAGATAIGYKNKLFIFGGLASQPDKDKLSAMSCHYVPSPNDKEILTIEAEEEMAADSKHEMLWRWSRSELDPSSIDNSSFFSRNIRQFSLDADAKVKLRMKSCFPYHSPFFFIKCVFCVVSLFLLQIFPYPSL